MSVLFAVTLPGLVLLLIALAAFEALVSRRRGRSRLSAAGLDVFSASVLPGRATELEERDEAKIRRARQSDGAPPHGVDLDGGTAHISIQ